MRLEQQVCSLRLAKKLKELSVKQESYFYWYGGKVLRVNQLSQELRRHEPPISAFTVAELGEMLPANVADNKKLLWQNQQKAFLYNSEHTPTYHIHYSYGTSTIYGMSDTSEADTRAKMLIYLIENNLLPPTNDNL